MSHCTLFCAVLGADANYWVYLLAAHPYAFRQKFNRQCIHLSKEVTATSRYSEL